MHTVSHETIERAKMTESSRSSGSAKELESRCCRDESGEPWFGSRSAKHKIASGPSGRGDEKYKRRLPRRIRDGGGRGARMRGSLRIGRTATPRSGHRTSHH